MWIFLSNICDSLNKNNVEYLIIGVTAVAFHGYSRLTTLKNGKEINKYDFDIWYRPTLSNYINLLKSLDYLGFDIKDDNDYTKFHFFHKEFESYNLDFLPNPIINKSLNINFKDFYNRRDITDVNNININFISINDIIFLKMNSNRPKDVRDVIELKKLM